MDKLGEPLIEKLWQKLHNQIRASLWSSLGRCDWTPEVEAVFDEFYPLYQASDDLWTMLQNKYRG